MMCVHCFLLFGVCNAFACLFVACRALRLAPCLLFVVSCLLFVVRLLLVVCCLLCVVCGVLLVRCLLLVRVLR